MCLSVFALQSLVNIKTQPQHQFVSLSGWVLKWCHYHSRHKSPPKLPEVALLRPPSDLQSPKLITNIQQVQTAASTHQLEAVACADQESVAVCVIAHSAVTHRLCAELQLCVLE